MYIYTTSLIRNIKQLGLKYEHWKTPVALAGEKELIPDDFI
jgi:hypothetical protein